MMNDRPVPPPLPTSDAADRLAEALRFRMFFAISFAVTAFSYLQFPFLAGTTKDVSRPNLLTWVLSFGTIVEIPLFVFGVFNPSRLPRRLIDATMKKGRTPRLRDYGLQLGGIGAALIFAPASCGFTLFIMSGQAWRALIFLPLSGIFALILWGRVGAVLETLAASGVR